MACHPELGIGDMNQLPPSLLALDIWGLEVSQAEPLFAKTEEVFQVESSRVALVNMEQSQFVTPFAHNQQPKGTFEGWFAIFTIAHNLHQGEGIFMHG